MRLIILSEAFYDEYAGCEQILQKKNRPYVCLEVLIAGHTYAIPFRHHIPHKHAFFTGKECGLDYTKAVLILDKRQIADETPTVSQPEYDAIKDREAMITNGLRKYIALYKKASKNKSNPHYRNILQYSTLQYFERYLDGL